MTSISLQSLVGTYVYIGFHDKLVLAGFEPAGPTKLIFVKLTGVDASGIFFEHEKFPLSNKRTGDVQFVRTQVFIPFQKISHLSAFPDLTDFDDYVPIEEPVTFIQ